MPQEIRSALHKAEWRLRKARVRRRKAAHDGASDDSLRELDVTIDEALEQCRVLRGSLQGAAQ